MTRRAAGWGWCAALLVVAACGGSAERDASLCVGDCEGGDVLWAVAASSTGSSQFTRVTANAYGELAIAGDFVGSLLMLGSIARLGSDGVAPLGFVAWQPVPGNLHDPVAVNDTGGSELAGIAADRDGQVLAVTVSPTSPVHIQAAVLGAYQNDAQSLPYIAGLYTAGTRPEIVLAADRHGRTIAAISAVNLERAPMPVMVGPRALIVRLDQGFVPTVLVSWPATVIRDLVIGPDDELVVVGDYTGAPTERFPPCATRCGFAARLAADGTLGVSTGWVTAQPGAADSSLSAVALDGADQLVALGSTSTDGEAAVLVRFGFDTGQVVSTRSLTTVGTVISARALASGADRTVYLAVSFRGSLQLGGELLASVATGDRLETVVAALALDGSAVWVRQFGENGSIEVSDLIVAGGRPVVTGRYWGRFARGLRDVRPPPTTTTRSPQGFALVLAP